LLLGHCVVDRRSDGRLNAVHEGPDSLRQFEFRMSCCDIWKCQAKLQLRLP
jgi:hypothetical protein